MEKAEGPDRELDLWIACAFPEMLGDIPEPVSDCHSFRPLQGIVAYRRGDSPAIFAVLATPRFTASLDAALELVEEKLPGWHVMRLGEGPDITPREREFEYDGTWFAELNTRQSAACSTWASGSTPALALLKALLLALQEKELAGD